MLISAPTAAGMATPAPRPSSPSPAAGMAKPVLAETMVSSPNEAAMTSIPPSTRNRGPIVAPALAPPALPTSAPMASGTKARPALTGE